MTTLSLPELTALHDIRRLKAQYAFFLDTKNWGGFRRLFTDDLVGKFGEGPEITGGDRYVELAAEAAQAATTIHQFHEPVLELTSATTATASWPVLAYLHFPDRSQPTTQNYGHYHERYRLTDDGWKIASTDDAELWPLSRTVSTDGRRLEDRVPAHDVPEN